MGCRYFMEPAFSLDGPIDFLQWNSRSLTRPCETTAAILPWKNTPRGLKLRHSPGAGTVARSASEDSRCGPSLARRAMVSLVRVQYSDSVRLCLGTGARTLQAIRMRVCLILVESASPCLDRARRAARAASPHCSGVINARAMIERNCSFTSGSVASSAGLIQRSSLVRSGRCPNCARSPSGTKTT